MFELPYTSAEAKAFSDSELLSLLCKARIKNDALNVTGMLLYRNGINYANICKYMQIYANICKYLKERNKVLSWQSTSCQDQYLRQF